MREGRTIHRPAINPAILDYARAPRRTGLRRWAWRGALLLAIVLTLYAILVGALYWGWRAEQPAIAAIEQGGGELGVVRCDPEWLGQILPGPMGSLRARVNDIGLMGTQADALLTHVDGLSDVHSIDLGASQVTDAGVAHLKNLRRLTGLNLSDNPITDIGATNLAHLTALTYLYLNGTGITDASMVHLAGMTNLQKLGLGGTAVTDGGTANLKGMMHLEELGLSDTSITDASLGVIEHLPALKHLDLRGTLVSSAAVERFCKVRPDVQVDQPDQGGSGAANLALHKPATASSIENDEHNAAQANDGDAETYWCADDDSDGIPEFWQVDLQQAADLAGCQIRWQFDGKKYQYKVEGSADGKTWSLLSDQTRNVQTEEPHALKFENAKAIRYVRITVTGVEEGCWVGIREVKVSGR